MNGLTNAHDPSEPRKLVLCFDGTGNTFSGSDADTNVVKILHKLDRHAPRQFHYYQTGIGTYDINERSVNKTWLGEMKSSIAMTIDQGIGNTFDAHVMSGYRFLMKYYETGAKIYMFGFSRGAFTAKFLARMIHTVGLLCKGNEEMVPFAYRLYQRYLAGEIKDFVDSQARDDGDDDDADDQEDGLTNPLLQDNIQGDHSPQQRKFGMAHNEIVAFSNTFCRKEPVVREVNGRAVTEESNIKVYFLGIWDCVNSVAPLERHTPVPVPVIGTASYVRHAVSVDERRVKFKPALLSQDIRATADIESEDIKEVWFPGNHGDVGGGWPAVANREDENAENWTLWQRVKNFFTTRKAKEASADVSKDPFQLSDIPLAWMIRELQLVGRSDPAAAIQFSKRARGFLNSFQKKKEQALTGSIHDPLKFGYGFGFSSVLMWKFMEWLPFITRWELTDKGKWVKVRFPLNGGAPRDIPRDAKLHTSLLWRLQNDPSYHPANNHGGSGHPCLKHRGVVASLRKAQETMSSNDSKGHLTIQNVESDLDHEIYEFPEEKE
ncbi:hypothetical protein F5Y17DRAFT_455371 [Xylariaceae sp. FL0594]|nr:hypothetical protein F5Y17DRAFT_455371 [Xylariaceae sp. FL0594]